MKYDVIIAGAGPAGSSCAQTLASMGAKVLIIESRKLPRSKPCAELISAQTHQYLQSNYDVRDNSRLYKHQTNSAAFYHNNQLLNSIDATSKIRFVDRQSFDFYLTEFAVKSGADLIEGRKVIRCDHGQNKVFLKGGEPISAKFVVGADGPLSAVARSLYGKVKNYRQNTAVGVVAKLPRDSIKITSGDPGYGEKPNIYFSAVNWGYGWVFPNDEYLNIGVAGLIQQNPNMMRSFHKFIRMLPVKNNGKVKPAGHIVPFGRGAVRLGKNNTLLIGDAAGLVEPITGEGIYFALKSGRNAAEAVMKHLEINCDVNKAYTQRCRPILKILNQAYLSRYLLFHRVFNRFALRTIKSRQRFSSNFMDVLSGKTDYIGYFKRALLTSRSNANKS